MRPAKKSPSATLPIETMRITLDKNFPINMTELYYLPDTIITHLHYHELLEIGICHSGEGIFMVNGAVYTFKTGDITVIAPGQTHLAQSRTGTQSMWTWLYLDPALLIGPLASGAHLFDSTRFAAQAFPVVFSRNAPDSVATCMEILYRELTERKRNYREAVRALTLQLMVLLDRIVPRDYQSPHPQNNAPQSAALLRRLHPSLDIISKQYMHPLPVDQMARACFLSTTHFRRLFKELLHQSPQEYLLSVRLSMACCNLTGSDKSIAQIARDCGFTTLSSFNRAFRLAKGVSPREFRRLPQAAANA